jgi:predicted nucleic acid-binding protein
MIILDTNVLSELMRASPSERVAKWLGSLPPSTVFTTAVTKAEILYGLELMPRGHKRELLQRAATAMLRDRFPNRVLPFAEDASPIFAQLGATRRGLGRPIGQFDCQIASIARIHGASVATRDVRDFADCGLDLIDPWA